MVLHVIERAKKILPDLKRELLPIDYEHYKLVIDLIDKNADPATVVEEALMYAENLEGIVNSRTHYTWYIGRQNLGLEAVQILRDIANTYRTKISGN